MTFREAEDYLLGLELFGMRFGLDRSHALMAALGTPQRRFASIHVVGSNGKSSTVRFTAAIIERHGLRTGTYTSPHLRSFRERIEVGEEPVSEERFAGAVERAAEAARAVDHRRDPDDRVTQFEALTAAAYDELAAAGVEVAVIEAGLGGRHDATSVIGARVQVLTSVSLEHTRWLGPTVAHIAEEKLAVVRDGGVLVVGELDPVVQAAAERAAREHCARLVPAPAAGAAATAWGPALRTAGGFQRQNFALAVAAAEAFLDRPLDPDAVRDAAVETRVPGRLDVVSEHPVTIYDGAHNPAGARALAAALPEVLAPEGAPAPSNLVLVAAMLEDKDAAGMLEALLPLADRAIFTRCSNPRSLPPDALRAVAAEPGRRGGTGRLGAPAGETVDEPRAAVERARKLAGPHGAVVATGSIYLIADLVREPGAAPASAL